MSKDSKRRPQKKKIPIRLPVPPPGGPEGTKRGRRGYDRALSKEELLKALEEMEEEEEEGEGEEEKE